MKKILLIIVFSVCSCMLAAADLYAGTVGAGGATRSTEVFTIGETIVGTCGSTSYLFKAGYVPVWRALSGGNPRDNSISINSAGHYIHEKMSRFSVYVRSAGTVQISIAGRVYTSEAVTIAPATRELSSALVSQDLYKSTVTAHLGTACATSTPAIYGQDLLLGRQGQTPVAANLSVYCAVGAGTNVSWIINNIGNASTSLVLTGTSTGSGWKVIYKDGSTDITSYVEGNGYPLTLSSAEKRTISIILMPLDSNSGTLQISLSAYTNGYPLNIVTRSISAQGGVEPSQKFTTSSVGYNQETGKMNVYFVASSDQLGGASISATQETLAKLFIYNLSGKLVYQQDVPVSAGYNLVEVQATLGRGTYIYQLVYNGKVIYSGTFVNKS